MSKTEEQGCAAECRRAQERRTLLRAAVALGATWPFAEAGAVAPDDPALAAPKAGDKLVFGVGEHKGKPITPDAVVVGAGQILAFPMEPKDKIVRDGNRLNQVIVIRLQPEAIKPETAPNSADGVVAYSSICTHQGCDVSQWKTDTNTLLCVCHGSEYDPADRAKVVAGPAPRRLAMLPIKVVDGEFVVTAPFTGRPGPRDL
jgi:rieske iron-sulfur protein